MQLAAAEKSEDRPAIIELSRRLIETASKESGVWEKLARTQVDAADYERCTATLDAWETAVKARTAANEDLRGDICHALKDLTNAERHWLAFIAKKPPAAEAAATFDALAELCVEQARWREHADYRARALAAQPTAARQVAKACALLRLRQWDQAFAAMKAANASDPADDQVKEWLPQFERLKAVLPRIRVLDAQIANNLADAGLWLERARVLTLADRPLLASDDCEHALKLAPASLRARVQSGEALQDSERSEQAVKLQISHDLLRADKGHVSERALREIGTADIAVFANPNHVEPWVARSKALRGLRQFTLALVDARAALGIDENSAAAHFECAHDSDGLGDSKAALVHIVKATELEPENAVMWFYRGVIEAQRANFSAAIASQTRSITIRESLVALQEREKCARRLGLVASANADEQRARELDPSHP